MSQIVGKTPVYEVEAVKELIRGINEKGDYSYVATKQEKSDIRRRN